MKKPKYIVRPDDFSIFEIDQTNGRYRIWEKNPNNNKSRPKAMKHFTLENLTKNYHFFPINESEIEYYEQKSNEHYNFISWKHRPDGHGGIKDGTYEQYLTSKK
jgi:hypothetical protein